MPIPDFYKKFHKDISWINYKTIYLTLHGSRAYGTNTVSSDEDFKGVCIPPKEYYIGGKRFEQAELHDPDAVIYEFRKFISLAAACNPNIIEVLFVDPKDIIYIDSIGEELLANRESFLSKRIRYTFSGYAVSQLKRIRLHRRWIMNPPSKPPTRKDLKLPERTLIPKDQLAAASAAVQKEMDRFNFDFMEGLDESTKIGIKNTMSEMIAELQITSEDQWMASARKVGLSDNLIDVMQKEREYTSKKREWDQYQNWKKSRNPARAALEEKFGFDTKHAYHLVRLIRMCGETLTTGKVIVKRPDREELLAIRDGAWSYDQLIEFAESEEKRLNELYKTCDILPKTADKHKLDKLCMRLVERSLSKYSWYNIRKIFNRI